MIDINLTASANIVVNNILIGINISVNTSVTVQINGVNFQLYKNSGGQVCVANIDTITAGSNYRGQIVTFEE